MTLKKTDGPSDYRSRGDPWHAKVDAPRSKGPLFQPRPLLSYTKTLVTITIVLAILSCLAMLVVGPLLCGLAPSASAFLAGEILIFIALGKIGIGLFYAAVTGFS